MSQPQGQPQDSVQASEAETLQSITQLGVQINGALASGQALATAFTQLQKMWNSYQSEIRKLLLEKAELLETVKDLKARLAAIEKKPEAKAKP